MSVAASWLESWLTDVYLFSSLLLIVALAAQLSIRQPARRLAVARAAFVGVMAVIAWRLASGLAPRPGIIHGAGPVAVSEAVDRFGESCDPSASASVECEAATAPTAGLPSRELECSAAVVPSALLCPPHQRTEPASSRRGCDAESTPSLAGATSVRRIAFPAGVFLAGSGLCLSWLALGALAKARLLRGAEVAPEPIRSQLLALIGRDGRVPRVH
jgi:hypothetical protein